MTKCDGMLCRQSKEPNEGQAMHTCPYKTEINNDKEALCNCCDECTLECVDNI